MKTFESEKLGLTRVVKEESNLGRRTKQMFYYIEQGSDFEDDESCSRVVMTFSEALEVIELLKEATKYNGS